MMAACVWLPLAAQTETHLHFVMEFCDGGELYGLLNAQPKKRLKESHVRFYVAEVRAAAFSTQVVAKLLN